MLCWIRLKILLLFFVILTNFSIWMSRGYFLIDYLRLFPKVIAIIFTFNLVWNLTLFFNILFFWLLVNLIVLLFFIKFSRVVSILIGLFVIIIYLIFIVIIFFIVIWLSFRNIPICFIILKMLFGLLFMFWVLNIRSIWSLRIFIDDLIFLKLLILN